MRKPDSINRPLMAALGRRVRARREAIEPNQATFAGSVDYDRNLWGRIERGDQNVSVSTLAKVSAALGVGLGELLEGIEAEIDAERRVRDPGPSGSSDR